ncbi:MAG: HAD family hydrolase [Verrucomicrobia bacterium]|nr:HAD family hydrolase [Verrucomicrobiota bacterium]
MSASLRPKRAVVFDLDGTLLDSLPLVLEAIRHALEPFGGSPTMDIFARLGGPPERFLADLLPDPVHVPVALRRMVDFHHGNHRLIQPYAGAVETLRDLRARGIPAGIWTGRDRASTRTLLASHGLDGIVDGVVCGDDLPTHKPDPEGLLALVSRLGCAPAETLLVGDADVDVLGGHAGGVETVLIRHQRTIAPAVTAVCWRDVASPAEAYALVRARLLG